MKKEDLIAMGLTEEQAKQVMAEHGKTVTTLNNNLSNLQSEADNYKSQLEQRDKDLKELKKSAEGNADLQKQYDDLQQKYKEEKKDFEEKIKATQLNSALKLALNGKVHDSDLVSSLIDKETIELDENGNIVKGLEEQVKTLQDSKSFLFVSKDDGSPEVKGARPADGDESTNRKNVGGSYGEQLAKESSESNKGLEEARNSYFG